ncbi:bifunctional 5,10-methylenetetrahydrofolate dehydrogenase/5,10-methenyltetrahydrofolate cyclohydrolase [Mycoplasma enhydrae]|uniref:bifunctional 5,10-methylenetetrahydrofolate dehydrogenase/5,10-methenyltetrahydrofolate cyclohydrolase n=1 Tax=Mycoplasma enhydrae TaxID=2499220 RepID=UPI0021E8B593|nr:bifunctional 5,10-methylenetetrahydrofolate dehydrogenase/5,10-methenyltetrahydrofolate cyclohydrolase [Mycoplasma enhydrae]MCV3733662.1 bifunctional 5,10-methylenetetrahydrofolate dehydrogenase/5,10-methenyltetrahydrofolate cyclohydrolase [Mycoplasma enhydrae]MCV3753357.1 bifunctional 5,10-methylenetetrahydrofolate dehydrogenase/5,10-methenyltetrahydrofolate cyclohydrolase [Mycoplasma enhydrae]
MYKILDGKKTSEKLKNRIRDELKKLALNNMPILGILQVGDLEESNIYIKHKLKAAHELGISTEFIKLSKRSTQVEIIEAIQKLNEITTGFIVQLPMDASNKIDVDEILNKIPQIKDIDGLNDANQSSNYISQIESFLPATDLGILLLLKEYNIEFKNKTIGIVGQSKIVGRPLANYFEQLGLIVNRYDKNTPKNNMTNNDIVIVATGTRNCLKDINLKNNVILVDVGIHRINNDIVGDVDINNIKTPISYLSPVPGGVGPMTIIGLILNLIKSYDIQNNKNLYENILRNYKKQF